MDKSVRLQVILFGMQFTGLGKEETSITGATPKCIFLFSSDSAIKIRMYEKFGHAVTLPREIIMEFSLERFVTERDED